LVPANNNYQIDETNRGVHIYTIPKNVGRDIWLKCRIYSELCIRGIDRVVDRLVADSIKVKNSSFGLTQDKLNKIHEKAGSGFRLK